jgi:hypothetical protein
MCGEVGYTAAVDPAHINDLQATILRMLGIDHTRLTYQYKGRRFRLTDLAGKVPGSLPVESATRRRRVQ